MPDKLTNAEQLIEGHNYSVMSPGMWENDQGPKDWFGVCSETSGGFVAYAATEPMAVGIANWLQFDAPEPSDPFAELEARWGVQLAGYITPEQAQKLVEAGKGIRSYRVVGRFTVQAKRDQ